MNVFQKLRSYVFSSTRRIASDFNGELEVTLINGRKVLDSAHANYSYGSLQRILRFALQQIDLGGVKSVLLLGLGGGSVVATLRQEFAFGGHITAVDLDPAVIRIAAEEFGIVPDDNLAVFCADAQEYLRCHPARHDLVIVDVFIDNQVPAPFLAPEFWQLVAQRVAPVGVVVFNSMRATGNAARVSTLLHGLDFAVQEFRRVEKTNTLLVGRRTPPPAGPGAGE